MILLPRVGLAVLVAVGVCLGAAEPAAQKTTARATKSKKRRYRSSVGKPVPKTALSAKKTPVKTAAKKVTTATATARRRVTASRVAKISAATRMEANQGVFQKVSNGATIP